MSCFYVWFLAADFHVPLLVHVHMMHVVVSFVIPVLDSMAIQFAFPSISCVYEVGEDVDVLVG